VGVVKRLVAVPLLCLSLSVAGLSACSSTDSSSPSGAEATSSTQQRAADTDLAEVASGIGCTGWKVSDAAVPGIEEYGTCQWEGQRVQLYRAGSENGLAAFWKEVAVYGVTEQSAVSSGLLVAAPGDPADVLQLRAALGW